MNTNPSWFELLSELCARLALANDLFGPDNIRNSEYGKLALYQKPPISNVNQDRSVLSEMPHCRAVENPVQIGRLACLWACGPYLRVYSLLLKANAMPSTQRKWRWKLEWYDVVRLLAVSRYRYLIGCWSEQSPVAAGQATGSLCKREFRAC